MSLRQLEHLEAIYLSIWVVPLDFQQGGNSRIYLLVFKFLAYTLLCCQFEQINFGYL